MNTPDKQILRFIDLMKDYKIILYDTDFCEAIGIKKQNLYKIRKGETHFTTEHIEKIITTYKVNANWIFGVSGIMDLIPDPSKPPVKSISKDKISS